MSTAFSSDTFWVSHALSAAYLLDTQESRNLRKQMDRWITACEPMITPEKALRILHSEQGTPLDPFSIPKRAESLAVAVMRLCTAVRSELPRIRIVSATSLQERGGLFLTKKLKTFYGDIFPYSQRPRPLSSTPYLLLNRIPEDYSSIKPANRAFSSTLLFEKSGSIIKISAPLELLGAGSQTKSISQELSSLLGRKISFSGYEASISSLGLRIEIDELALIIRSGNAASLTRFMSILASGATLTLQGTHDDAFTVVLLTLPPADQESVSLESIHFPNGVKLPWMRLPIRIRPDLDGQAVEYLKSLLAPDILTLDSPQS